MNTKMTADLAASYLHDFFNDADHIVTLYENAKAGFESGDYVAALEDLALAQRPASRVSGRLSSAIQAIEQLRDG